MTHQVRAWMKDNLTGLCHHGKRWGMRFLIFVLMLIVSARAHSASSVSGTLERDSLGYFLKHTGSKVCQRFQIVLNNDDTVKNLRKLSRGDLLTGLGNFNEPGCLVNIDTIDYVGLRRLIGHWVTTEGIISIPNFHTMIFYPSGTLQSGGLLSAKAINYRYSMTPSTGREWVLFISDETSTFFATLQLSKNSGVLKVYDSDSGKIVKQLRLEKWGSPN